MKGPLLVKLLAGWLQHEGRYVPWDRVRAIEQDRILISGSVDDLPEPGPATWSAGTRNRTSFDRLPPLVSS